VKLNATQFKGEGQLAILLWILITFIDWESIASIKAGGLPQSRMPWLTMSPPTTSKQKGEKTNYTAYSYIENFTTRQPTLMVFSPSYT